MKIAVVGTGIAGNVAAHHLAREHEITVFESANRVGGHANTVDVVDGGRELAIDTGFIVFNDRTYPNFIGLLDELGQPVQKSVMSFSVRCEKSGLEYNGSSLNGLFSQRRNLLRPAFVRMVRDILRFNREALVASQRLPDSLTVGDFLHDEGYGSEFANDYLVPMTAAIWSAEPLAVIDMPLGFLVRFFHNHGLLQLRDRPTWYTVTGGAREYVHRLTDGHRDRIRLGTPVQSISRLGGHVQIKAAGCQPEQFDHVFIACHSDQALAMLADPTPVEREVLGSIRYQPNEAVLHTDRSLMPRRNRTWAAWNYHIPRSSESHVSVTYNMNILQSLEAKQQYLVTLNRSDAIDPARIVYQTRYEHPVYTLETLAAQARHREINRGNMTSYCGAYWRNGFHEDGVWSALTALEQFNGERQSGELPVRRAG